MARLSAIVDRRIGTKVLGVFTEPGKQIIPAECAGSQVEDESRLVLRGGHDFDAVQHQKRRHRRVADAFVAVHEGMVLHERHAQRGGLLDHRRVEVFTAEGGARLREGRIQEAKVAKNRWRRRSAR